jgi:hypothetical protein
MWIVLAVCWYRRLGLSYRDVEELLSERGVEVDQVTIYRWVLRFTPLLATPLGPAATPSVSLAGGRDRCEGGWPVALRLRAIDQFGPVLVVNRVRDAEEGLTRANGLPYALGGSVFAKRPRAGVGPAHAIGHDGGELGAVVCRHAEPAVWRCRRLQVRAHERRGWAARVRPVQGHHGAPGAVAAARLDVRAGSSRDRAACRDHHAAALWPLVAAPAAKGGRAAAARRTRSRKSKESSNEPERSAD